MKNQLMAKTNRLQPFFLLYFLLKEGRRSFY